VKNESVGDGAGGRQGGRDTAQVRKWSARVARTLARLFGKEIGRERSERLCSGTVIATVGGGRRWLSSFGVRYTRCGRGTDAGGITVAHACIFSDVQPDEETS
jgi:hypothetical protein